MLAVPTWQLGRPVTMHEMQRVTDVYYKSLEPSRRLRLPTMPAQVTDSLAAHAKSLGQESGLAELKVSLHLGFLKLGLGLGAPPRAWGRSRPFLGPLRAAMCLMFVYVIRIAPMFSTLAEFGPTELD